MNDITTIFDIEAAYLFLINEFRFQPTKIIIYGYSIGSGPSIALASSPRCIVGGLIIHSGLASGIKVID